MAESSSGSARSRAKRCPKCRRRMGKLSMRCDHCNWQVPYRQVYLMLMTLCVALVVIGGALVSRRLLGGGASANAPSNVELLKGGKN